MNTYERTSSLCCMHITKTKRTGVVTIDSVDYERVARISWTINTFGYVVGYFQGSNVLLHRFILNLPDNDFEHVVHHIDDNPLNNTRANLVKLTRTEHAALHQSQTPWALKRRAGNTSDNS